jgi:hypothetical protein
LDLKSEIKRMAQAETEFDLISELPLEEPDQTGQQEWTNITTALRALHERAVGNHFCTWTDPCTLTFGERKVSLTYPVRDFGNDLPRALMRFYFSDTARGSDKPGSYIETIWAKPIATFEKRFCWKVWGPDRPGSLESTFSLGKLILDRLRAVHLPVEAKASERPR